MRASFSKSFLSKIGLDATDQQAFGVDHEAGLRRPASWSKLTRPKRGPWSSWPRRLGQEL